MRELQSKGRRHSSPALRSLTEPGTHPVCGVAPKKGFDRTRAVLDRDVHIRPECGRLVNRMTARKLLRVERSGILKQEAKVSERPPCEHDNKAEETLRMNIQPAKQASPVHTPSRKVTKKNHL
jgi:hypothetical protein